MAVVGGDEPALSHGGGGLKFGQSGRTAACSKNGQARGDGPRTDQHDFAATLAQGVEVLGQLGDRAGIDGVSVSGQDVRTDLDDHAPHFGQQAFAIYCFRHVRNSLKLADELPTNR